MFLIRFINVSLKILNIHIIGMIILYMHLKFKFWKKSSTFRKCSNYYLFYSMKRQIKPMQLSTTNKNNLHIKFMSSTFQKTLQANVINKIKVSYFYTTSCLCTFFFWTSINETYKEPCLKIQAFY